MNTDTGRVGRKPRKNKRLSFPFFFSDWLSDPDVRAMSCLQKGIYIDLLAICAQESGIYPHPSGHYMRVVFNFRDDYQEGHGPSLDEEFEWVMDNYFHVNVGGRLWSPRLYLEMTGRDPYEDGKQDSYTCMIESDQEISSNDRMNPPGSEGLFAEPPTPTTSPSTCALSCASPGMSVHAHDQDESSTNQEIKRQGVEEEVEGGGGGGPQGTKNGSYVRVKERPEFRLNDLIDTPDVHAALKDWMKMRQRIKKPLVTQKGYTRSSNRLWDISKGDPKVAVKVIEQSTDHCWVDFWPPTDGNQKPGDDIDIWGRRILKR